MPSYAGTPDYVGTKPTWRADYHTDYYSVVALAVSHLPSKTDEARHALYERARTTLKKKLQSHDRPVSAAGQTTAQFRLEAAIRRVEMELVFSDMPRAKEEAALSPPSLGLPPNLSFISKVEEFVRSVGDKLISYITMMRDRLRSSEATKVVPTKADITTARLAQAMEFRQKLS